MSRGDVTARRNGHADDYNVAWQDYLQAIYYLGLDGGPVISARLAEWLDVSPPSVAAMLRRMQGEGLLEMGPRKEILLSEQGRLAAEAVARRHYLAERLLTEIVGLDWASAHHEAERWQHAISDTTEWPLWEALGKPTTCPHGTPIPGLPTQATVVEQLRPLSGMSNGAEGVVERIVEDEKEDLSELLRFLGQHRIVPGAHLRVLSVAPFNQTVSIAGEAGEVTLGLAVAEKVLVRPR
ncbi:MAG: metal-dependent transcriptional regulator [Chloroflexota bacterium]|nr:metal-dependent transcriptional regulator [Chloroflexota bacterium]